MSHTSVIQFQPSQKHMFSNYEFRTPQKGDKSSLYSAFNSGATPSVLQSPLCHTLIVCFKQVTSIFYPALSPTTVKQNDLNTLWGASVMGKFSCKYLEQFPAHSKCSVSCVKLMLLLVLIPDHRTVYSLQGDFVHILTACQSVPQDKKRAKIINDKLSENPHLSTVSRSMELHTCELICIYSAI